MITTIRLSKKEAPNLWRLALAAFPDYRGRKLGVEVRTGPIDVRGYWDGGSRTYFVFVHLETGKRFDMPAQSAFDRPLPGAERVALPPDVACVEHVYFCGKDLGLRVIVNPEGCKQLPEIPLAALPAPERLALQA